MAETSSPMQKERDATDVDVLGDSDCCSGFDPVHACPFLNSPHFRHRCRQQRSFGARARVAICFCFQNLFEKKSGKTVRKFGVILQVRKFVSICFYSICFYNKYAHSLISLAYTELSVRAIRDLPRNVGRPTRVMAMAISNEPFRRQ